MFSRIKGVIDQQIAAEQARSAAAQKPTVSRSNSRLRPGSRSTSTAPAKGETEKDPAEFETDSDAATPGKSTPARPGTPAQPESVTVDDPLGALTGGEAGKGKEGDRERGGELEQKKDSNKEVKLATKDATGSTRTSTTTAGTASLASNPDLPSEVRVKLRKLDKIEGKYAELLRSYKIVHARCALIEPFEKSLRENTPCESISDPKSLIDYINSFSVRADLAKEEMVRVAKERDEFKAQAQKAKLDIGIKDKQFEEMKASLSEKEAELKKRAEQKERASDDIFNFDDEHSDLQAKVESLQTENSQLQNELEATKQGKKVAEEAVESMQKSVEDSQWELEGYRETGAAKDVEIRRLHEKVNGFQQETDRLKSKVDEISTAAEVAQEDAKQKLEAAEAGLQKLAREEGELEETKNQLGEKVKLNSGEGSSVQDLRKELNINQETLSKLEKERRAFEDKVSTLEASLKHSEKLSTANTELQRTVVNLEDRLRQQKTVLDTSAKGANPFATQSANGGPPSSSGGGPKKKNKKKKKGKGRASGTAATSEGAAVKETEIVDDEHEPEQEETHSAYSSETIITDLQNQLEELRTTIPRKEARIAELSQRAVDADELREEIESLRDDLVNVGQDHVRDREKLRGQTIELREIKVKKEELEAKLQTLESELGTLREQQSSASATSEQAYKTLQSDYESLKVNTASLQTDLSAVQQLAASRFKDLSELRSVIEKAQPELTSLRAENATLTVTKNELNKQVADLKRLERAERDLKNDLTVLNRKMTERDNEISALKKKNSEELTKRQKAEEQIRALQKDIRKAEDERKDAVDNLEQATSNLTRAQEELSKLKPRILTLENDLRKLRQENQEIKEDLALKTAQVASTQSLMNSMRDQTSELAMQMKEAKDQRESAEEELADAQRLLTERTREAETMRRLLNEVGTRHEVRTREMKERMEVAIEERDNAEEEVATVGRRRAREIEDLKDRVRDAERVLRQAEEARELAESECSGLRDGKKRVEELLERDRRELEDTKRAMASLTATLDSTDGQFWDIERQKTELRQKAEQAELKYEKLQKQHRILQDEVRSIQTMRAKALDNDGENRPSSRTSVDSSRSNSRVMSPRPQASNNVDLVYLKNVLLQFMELKDRNQRTQLVRVLAMLLGLDRKEEQQWVNVVKAG